MSDRCTGDCCRALTIPYSPEELAENYRAWRESDLDGDFRDRNGHRTLVDIHLIYPMLRSLGLFKKGEVPPSREAEVLPRDAYYYRCTHLDEETGNCGIYDIRPQVCRTYPDSQCLYKGCTWEAAREGRVSFGELVQIGGGS